tara:strand:+ start:583 stop:795 length:213 start_codon:yes stop_codon:yes gene_type:complete
MKNAILGAIIIATMNACSSTQKFNEIQFKKFKEATEGVHRGNKNEVRLAQILYIEMRNNQKRGIFNKAKK